MICQVLAEQLINCSRGLARWRQSSAGHSLHALRLWRPVHLATWIFMIDRLWSWCRPYKSRSDLNRNQSSLVTFDLLTLKVVSESRETWATSVPILVFLGLSALDLGPMYATNVRQTDVRQKYRLMPRLLGAGHNNTSKVPTCRPVSGCRCICPAGLHSSYPTHQMSPCRWAGSPAWPL